MIKAERLRRIIESADFSRVLEKFPHMTISLGVSEYPTLVRDAEELKQSADEALYQVRAKGNKTCVAKVNDGFEADFKIANKAP
jgi:diguanylate cyclase (GGDEF)-like protein